MDRRVGLEQKILIQELTQGKESAEQLRDHLNPSSPSEARQFLLEKILSSYEKALTVLKYASLVQSKPTIAIVESPHNSAANSSPSSDISHQDQCQKYKKRKTQPSWTEQVKVYSESGFDCPVNDGYSWRKYGQKDILGSNHPRAYYRCTHRHSRGCLAIKQMQRSDKDPSILEVTYRGRHTCTQTSNLTMNVTSKGHCQEEEEEEEKPMPSKEMFLEFGGAKGEGIKVETIEEAEVVKTTKDDIFRSLSFSFKSMGNDLVENDIFKESMVENDFLGCLSPAFISPATSESNYFGDMNNFGICYNVQTPESDIISAPTSITNSPIDDFDISIDNVDFDANFPLDNL